MERETRQREAIRAVIEAARRPLSPQEVLDLARATVYRNLKLLVAEGEVQAISLPGDSPRYELAHSPHHHHHFQCTACLRVYDIHGCAGNWRQMAPRGFRVERHHVTLYGRCSDCGPREARAAR